MGEILAPWKSLGVLPLASVEPKISLYLDWRAAFTNLGWNFQRLLRELSAAILLQFNRNWAHNSLRIFAFFQNCSLTIQSHKELISSFKKLQMFSKHSHSIKDAGLESLLCSGFLHYFGKTFITVLCYQSSSKQRIYPVKSVHYQNVMNCQVKAKSCSAICYTDAPRAREKSQVASLTWASSRGISVCSRKETTRADGS